MGHMTIFFSRYEAIPLPEAEDFAVCGGAYINCWIQAQSEEEASELAAVVIHERGWKVVSVDEECREVDESLYAEDDKHREYYDQAVLDGGCYVFHQWPVDDQDGAEMH